VLGDNLFSVWLHIPLHIVLLCEFCVGLRVRCVSSDFCQGCAALWRRFRSEEPPEKSPFLDEVAA